MIFIFWVMTKLLQVGLSKNLQKFSITVSKSTKNLWFVSKLQNFNIMSSINVLRVFNLWYDESNLVLFWNWIGFAIWEKRYELCDFYDFVVISRWNAHVCSTALLCDLKVYICVCLVWRWAELILIELNLTELILVKSELDVNWFMFGYTHLKVILMY